MNQTNDISRELESILKRGGATLWGFADIAGLTRKHLSGYSFAVSFALANDPAIMASISGGPNETYAELYIKANACINTLSAQIEAALQEAGHQAWAVPASLRSDPDGIRGDFPHKTAATRAGLGWIGKHAQLVTFKLGPWLRLGTVLTSCPLHVGSPVERSFCGQCDACVEACPAGALHGADWAPGLEREKIFAPAVCDQWKKTHYQAFHGGRTCGICAAACPFGQKLLNK